MGERSVAPAWAADPRLEPLPLALRPGWTDEPLVPRRRGTAETLGVTGLVLSGLALPFSFCCGVGVVVGAPLALIGGGLCVGALVTAPRTRNPATARWTGGIGLALAVLTLLVSLALALVAFGALGQSSFRVGTP